MVAARKAFLLNPSAEYAKRISDLYLRLNLPINSAFFESLASRGDTQAYLEKIYGDKTAEKFDFGVKGFNTVLKTKKVGDRALVYASRLQEDHPFVQKVTRSLKEKTESKDPATRLEAVEDAKLLGPHGVDILRVMSNDTEPLIKRKADAYLSFYQTGIFSYSDSSKW